MPIFWHEGMSVGGKAIDDEHKYLFALVNCVELSLKTGDRESILKFIDQLLDYTREHFSHEEKLQIAIKYPYYLENKTQHIQILENLDELRTRFLPDKKEPAAAEEASDVDTQPAETKGESVQPDAIEPELVKEITELLRKWILEHVLVIDRKMHPFLSRLTKEQLKKYL